MTASTFAIASGTGQLLVGPGLDNARAKHEGLYFLLVEHQRRQVETGLQHIADAGLPLDRHAADNQILDVTVDCALRHLQGLAEIARTHELLAAHELDDFEQTIGAAHAVVPTA
jgi:hypothetical protein